MSTQVQNKNHFAEFPIDMLNELFSFLTIGEASVIKRVCKQFKLLIDAHPKFKTMAERGKIVAVIQVNLDKYAPLFRTVTNKSTLQSFKEKLQTARTLGASRSEELLNVGRFTTYKKFKEAVASNTTSSCSLPSCTINIENCTGITNYTKELKSLPDSMLEGKDGKGNTFILIKTSIKTNCFICYCTFLTQDNMFGHAVFWDTGLSDHNGDMTYTRVRSTSDLGQLTSIAAQLKIIFPQASQEKATVLAALNSALIEKIN